MWRSFEDAVRVTKILQMMYVNQQLADLDDAHEEWMRGHEYPLVVTDDDEEVAEGGSSKAPNIEATEESDDDDGAQTTSVPGGSSKKEEEDDDGTKKKELPSAQEFNSNEHYIESGEFETEETWENRKQDLVDHKSDQPVYFTLPKPNLEGPRCFL